MIQLPSHPECLMTVNVGTLRGVPEPEPEPVPGRFLAQPVKTGNSGFWPPGSGFSGFDENMDCTTQSERHTHKSVVSATTQNLRFRPHPDGLDNTNCLGRTY